jgi:pantoate--beta-alanine ligase
MEIFKQIAPLKALLNTLKKQGKSVGLVPTMGALHAGHISLIKASQAENDITVTSIYVNPTQFNNPLDLSRYPRTLDRDTELLKEVRSDVLFCPDDAEMYPEASKISISLHALDNVMEGEYRPGHFSGVALVVSKLFNIVQPHKAYFGQKDWQQFAVISRVVEEMKFDIDLRSIPTVREADGLAMSSRNQRLSPKERKEAAVLYRALREAKAQLTALKSVEEVEQYVKKIVESAPSMRLEYFEVADSKNLNVVKNVSSADDPILCIAGYAGEVRLIDNLFLYDDFEREDKKKRLTRR